MALFLVKIILMAFLHASEINALKGKINSKFI
jgi:hypothetical protein